MPVGPAALLPSLAGQNVVKRIDLAVGFSLDSQRQAKLDLIWEKTFDTLYTGLNIFGGKLRSDVDVVHVEVKIANSGVDPRVQLMVAAATHFAKRDRERWVINEPIVSISICGDDWVAYIACRANASQRIVSDLFFCYMAPTDGWSVAGGTLPDRTDEYKQGRLEPDVDVTSHRGLDAKRV